jgi:hypothetical protein
MGRATEHHNPPRVHGEASSERTCRRGHPWLRDKYDRCLVCADINREKWRAAHPDKRGCDTTRIAQAGTGPPPREAGR